MIMVVITKTGDAIVVDMRRGRNKSYPHVSLNPIP